MQITCKQKEFVKTLKWTGEYHELHAQSDILLLANVFNNFQNLYFEMYGPDPVRLLSAPGKKTNVKKKKKVKLDLLTDINMLLMVEKGIRGRICHAIHQYVNNNNKYLKDYNNNKESAYQLLGCK